MKKFPIILLSVLLILSCSSFAFAEDLQFDNIADLLDYWQANIQNPNNSPYPDYVCGIWSTDGSMDHLNIALVEGEAGEKGKEEILSMLKSSDGITFSTLKYSHGTLCGIQNDFLKNVAWQDKGVFGFGVDEKENVLAVDIDMNNSFAQGFMNECFDRYGDLIKFENGSGATIATAESRGEGANFEKGRFESFPWASILTMPVLIALFCIYGNIQKHKDQSE